MRKFEEKLNNFAKALSRLKEAVIEFGKENSNDVVRDGVIQRFEFTYELSWKTTKEYLESIGIVDKNSPKSVIKEAYTQKIIQNEENWLQMISDRNITSHVYEEDQAKEVVERIVKIYVNEFEQLLLHIKKTDN